jgi:molybdopterin converting factor small subunit
MPARLLIPTYLRPFTGGNSRVELPRSPTTVGAALEALWALYPGVRDRVVTEQGELRPHINVFVGEESVRFLHGLATRLPEECEVSILPAISGG